MDMSDRLEEQRCSLPSSMAENSVDNVEAVKKAPARKEPIQEVLLAGKPYPLVVLPVSGDYWQEGTNHVCPFDKKGKHVIKPIDAGDLVIEDDVGYCSYKNFFQKQEHFNFTGECGLGHLLLSIKYEENGAGSGEDEGEIVRVILRSADRIIRGAIATKDLPPCPGLREIVKQLVPDLLDDFGEHQFHPVIYPKASSLITRFDEHGHAEKFKVGVIYQRAQQTNEGQYFSNKSHSKAMHDFLQILGEEVELLGFKGYSGGLDTKNNQTGRKAVYTKFKGREIMFHVSTLLPFTNGDSQQLQRKRHIGNDIIAIIFQDENTPFCPSSIRSSFLHIFIVVQVEEAYSKNTRYKITVTSKEDVPEFGPSLPNPSVFSKNDPLLRDFLLTKLLNAELAAFKAKQFSTLMERTRKLLFEDLVSTLAKKSQEMMFNSAENGMASGQSRGRILSSLRNAFRSESFERPPEAVMRSKSLENLVDKSDDEAEKTRKKKRGQSHFKRHSVSEKTRRPFRQKTRGMFHHHSSPLTGVDTNETRQQGDVKPEQDADTSPTFFLRDRSPSGSFLNPDSPIMAELPRTFSSSLSMKDRERLNQSGTSETFVSHVDEAMLHQRKLNGLTSSPRIKKAPVHIPKTDGKQSPILKQKSFSSSTEEVSTKGKHYKDECEESLVATLRGDLYKLTREKAKLQRENEALRDDVKVIKEAMIKQAEDLCESQYELSLLLASGKQKGPLSASVV